MENFMDICFVFFLLKRDYYNILNYCILGIVGF